MSVSAHLRISLADYDRRIRTFIPHDEEMLQVTAATAAAALAGTARPVILDLGIGTGALAARCLGLIPGALLHGIDADPDMLEVARRRLLARPRTRPALVAASFLDISLPRSHAIVATLSLHHVAPAATKGRFYRRCFDALAPGGVLVNGDCCLSAHPAIRRHDMARWRAHLGPTDTPQRTTALLRAWSHEDTYLTLDEEWTLLSGAGFHVEVAWRLAPFAVIAGWKPRRFRTAAPGR
jgi:SAM-dependent methyltransferase